MSSAQFTARLSSPKSAKWFERASDWANPILVKESRQSLKSRQFVVTFLLVLTASWIASVLGLVMAGEAIEFGSAGRQFFIVFFLVLAVAVLIVVPFGVYRSLLSEREQNTFELLSITALSPRQIVWGKLLSALVQVLIFYSAIGPFIAFASLLQGFDLAQAAFLLVVAMFVSLLFSMTALMLAAVARQRQSQAVMSLVVLGGVAVGFFVLVGFAFEPSIFSFDDPDFWWGTGFAAAAGLSYFVLFQQIATAQLTFESDNRSSGIRVTCSVQFYLLWSALIGYHWAQGTTALGEEILVAATLSAVHWSVVGLIVSSESETLSRRIQRRLPKFALLRFFVSPFMPGGARGFLYLLLNLAAMWVISIVWMEYNHTKALAPPYGTMRNLLDKDLPSVYAEARIITAMCCYILVFAGIATALGRWSGNVSSEIKPGHVRVLVLLLFATGVIAPYVPDVLGLTDTRVFAFPDITNPFTTFDELRRGGGYSERILITLLIGATLAVMANLRAMQRGVLEIVFPKVKPLGRQKRSA